jgi:hypothetical protein
MVRKYLIILLLLAAQAVATVEDTGPGLESMWSSNQPSAESYWISEGVWPVPPIEVGQLSVSIELTGPVSNVDRNYVTPGNALEYVVTVENEGRSEVDAELTVDLKSCRPNWFDWTTKSLTVPPDGLVSQVLLVSPDTSAAAGEYGFEVVASASGYRSGSDSASFEIQDYDYVSETAISGTGQFQLSKDVRSMNTGVKSDKDIYFSGSVDALVKNEYLVEGAKGGNPNFQECDAVDNYVALNPNDALFGTETVKSSKVFGGVGAKIQESYNLQEMEFKMQEIDLHHTGSLTKRAEFQTADNFTGYFMIDAKQTIPGQRSTREHEEFLGSFEIQRKLIFKDQPKPTFSCFDGSCFDPPESSLTLSG